MSGGVARLRARLATALAAADWRWSLVHLLVVALGVLALVTASFARAPGLPGLWMVSFYSAQVLSLLSLACAATGRAGVVIRAVAFALTAGALAWMFASVESYADEGRFLDWHEISFRLRDPVSRAFVWELVASGRTLLLALGFAAAIAALHLALRRVPQRGALAAAVALAVAQQAGGLVALGTNAFGDPDYYTRYQRPVCAPWSWVHGFAFTALDNGISARRRADPQAAQAAFGVLAKACWADGPDGALAPLLGRYRGRNVVLIVMESHRLSDIAPFGAGAHGHLDLSPRLGGLAARGMFFTNYVQTGLGTFFAQFSLITGLPCSPHFTAAGSENGAELARLGRIPDFTAAGYTCEWLQATDPHFANWQEFLTAVAMPCWFRPDEVAGLDHREWTSWGMPDRQLLPIALRRYRARAGAGHAPYLLTLLTISNHSPYQYAAEPGETLPAGHEGGMRYADRHVGALIDGLLALPEAERPVVFVTADHSHHERLQDAEPLGAQNPEGFRLPGLLITPDGFAAGATCASPFTHEDVLDLLYALVGPPRPGAAKFSDRHRIAATTVTVDALSLFTPDLYLHAPDRLFAVAGRWRLEPRAWSPQSEPLRSALAEASAAIARIWPAEAP